jgi:hypothetical protein
LRRYAPELRQAAHDAVIAVPKLLYTADNRLTCDVNVSKALAAGRSVASTYYMYR